MANPVLNERAFTSDFNDDLGSQHVMTTSGTLGKTLILAALMAMTFSYTWYLQIAGFADKVGGLTTLGLIGGLVMVLIICFAPKNRFLPITTSLYALFEGLLLGSISAMFNKAYPGIVSQAVLGTVFTVFGMYLLYATKIIRVTATFQKVVVISTFAIFAVYMTQFILGFFHLAIPGLFSNTPLGIGICVAVIAVAALNLILDFNFIESFNGRVPAYFEWYGGFSLMVTIVWLYVEILRLLAMLQSRR